MTCDLVSVIIPVRNAIRTIEACLSSATRATVRGSPPEIVVIEDGSVDGTAEFVASFAKRAPGGCVRMMRGSGRGIASALNAGIASTSSRYIARLDADDEIHPERLERQLIVMEGNPNCGALGTRALIGESWDSAYRVHEHPTESLSLRLALLLSNPFVHPSMMIRRDTFTDVGGYSEHLADGPEDYELWSRISRKWELGNLSECYTLYRETKGSLSRARGKLRRILQKSAKISEENIRYISQTDSLSREHEALVATYYGLAKRNDVLRLSEACALVDKLALRIGGDRKNWSYEYRQVYGRMRNKFKVSCLLGRVSPVVLEMIRACKQQVERNTKLLSLAPMRSFMRTTTSRR